MANRVPWDKSCEWTPRNPVLLLNRALRASEEEDRREDLTQLASLHGQSRRHLGEWYAKCKKFNDVEQQNKLETLVDCIYVILHTKVDGRSRALLLDLARIISNDFSVTEETFYQVYLKLERTVIGILDDGPEQLLALNDKAVPKPSTVKIDNYTVEDQASWHAYISLAWLDRCRFERERQIKTADLKYMHSVWHAVQARRLVSENDSYFRNLHNLTTTELSKVESDVSGFIWTCLWRPDMVKRPNGALTLDQFQA